MKKRWIQVTATKPNGDFVVVSNTGLMDSGEIAYDEAEAQIKKIAEDCLLEGFIVERLEKPLDKYDLQYIERIEQEIAKKEIIQKKAEEQFFAQDFYEGR